MLDNKLVSQVGSENNHIFANMFGHSLNKRVPRKLGIFLISSGRSEHCWEIEIVVHHEFWSLCFEQALSSKSALNKKGGK